MKLCLLLVVVSGVLATGLAQDEAGGHRRDKPADAAELAAITERGRAVNAYDVAAWHGSDAVMELKPPVGVVGMYLCRRTAEGWVAGFGKLNAAGDKFLLAYEAVPTNDVNKPRVRVHDPIVEDAGEWLYIARTFNLVKTALGAMGRPYNIAIIHAPNSQWDGYAYPAQTDMKSFPTGADTRYLISADGTKIEETRRMHASLLEYDRSDKSKPTVAVYHTAFLDDAPEDMDVAYGLMMGGTPSYVMTKRYMYTIAADGIISYVMTMEAFQKTMKK